MGGWGVEREATSRPASNSLKVMGNLHPILSSDGQPGFRYGLRVIIVGVSYFLATQFAFWFSGTEGMASVWPAGAIGLVALLFNPRWLWPALLTVLFASGVAATIIAGRPPTECVGFMLANVAETVLSAGVILYTCGNNVSFCRLKEIGSLIFAATIINAVTASIGSGIAALTSGNSFWTSYQTWWVANGVGLILLAPVLGLMRQKFSSDSIHAHRKIEATLLLLSTGVGAGLFCGAAKINLPIISKPHLNYLGLIWIALVFIWIISRFGPRMMAVTLVMIAAITIGFTALEPGYTWNGYAREEALLIVQAYLGIAAVIGLFTAVAFEENRQAWKALPQGKVRIPIISGDLPREV